MDSFICPQCRRKTERLETFGTCEHCGHNALTASGIPIRPGDRVPEGWDRALKLAAIILFIVAGLQFVGGGLLAIVASSPSFGVPENVQGMILAEWIGLTAAFAGLGWLALYHPLPAAGIGLALYAVLTLMDFVTAPMLALRGLPLKVLVIGGLTYAIVNLMRRR